MGPVRPPDVVASLLVVYSMFEVWDEAGLGSGLVLGTTNEDWVRGGLDKIEIACAVQDEYVTLTVEIHDHEPAAALSPIWERTATTSAWLSSGRVRPRSLTMGPASEAVLDTGLTGPVTVRAATSGSASALEAFERAGTGKAADVSGLEIFLLQMWPAAT